MANMNDVAKLAKVSRGTVSNYINGIKIKRDSADRIEKAIETLHYVPNQAARALKKQDSDLIAFILPTIWTPFFAELTYYVQLELQKNNYKMLLCNSQNDYNLELDYLKMAMEQKVRGIITITYSDITPYITSDLPIVSIERYLNEKVPFVTSDNFGGAQLAAKELKQRGAKKLLMIVRHLPNNLGITERINGFIDYCQHRKINFEVHLDKGNSKDFPKRLEQFLMKAYQNECRYDGIFAATDRYAEYIYRSFVKLKWSIPDDVQLIGFDGAKSFASQQLYISTIIQDVERIAAISVSELLRIAIEKPNSPQEKNILPVKFGNFTTTKNI